MKKILALAIVALVVPSVALAGKPVSPPGQSKTTHGNSQSDSHSKAHPTVMYVLKGVITSLSTDSTALFTVPGTGSDPTTNPAVQYSCNYGSVTINVTRVNHKRVFEALTGNNSPLALTLCLDAKAKVIVKGKGKVALADAAGTYNNYGMVKVRYALKSFDPTTASDLQGFLSTAAKQVIVKKALPTS